MTGKGSTRRPEDEATWEDPPIDPARRWLVWTNHGDGWGAALFSGHDSASQYASERKADGVPTVLTWREDVT